MRSGRCRVRFLLTKESGDSKGGKSMAWRIHEQVTRAVIDCRVRGKVTGEIWLAGRGDPLHLDLEGFAWRDLAGCLLTLNRPQSTPDPRITLATEQRGLCGDMTASRKVKVPTVEIARWLEEHPREPFPFRWANSVYLEWYSERNGRVVIESHDCELSLSTPTWRATEEEEAEQQRRSASAMERFLKRLAEASQSSAPAGEDPENDASGPDDEEGSARLEELEQKARIQRLREEAKKLAGGELLSGSAAGLPLDVEEQFWKNIIACEMAPEMTGLEMLAMDGIHPPRPEALPDAEVTRQLWLLIEALARRSTFLDHTDHLSDRELYTLLLDRVLVERSQVFPLDSGWNTHVMLDDYGMPGSEPGPEAYLQYYADPETRHGWAAEFPEFQMPPSEKPRHDRDRHMPGPPS